MKSAIYCKCLSSLPLRVTMQSVKHALHLRPTHCRHLERCPCYNVARVDADAWLPDRHMAPPALQASLEMHCHVILSAMRSCLTRE